MSRYTELSCTEKETVMNKLQRLRDDFNLTAREFNTILGALTGNPLSPFNVIYVTGVKGAVGKTYLTRKLNELFVETYEIYKIDGVDNQYYIMENGGITNQILTISPDNSRIIHISKSNKSINNKSSVKSYKVFDLNDLGWFWAAKRDMMFEYYETVYLSNATKSTKELYLNHRTIGHVIYSGFLHRNEENLGVLMKSYASNVKYINHHIFGDDMLESVKPHTFNEMIFASFASHQYSMYEISLLFGEPVGYISSKFRDYDRLFGVEDKEKVV